MVVLVRAISVEGFGIVDFIRTTQWLLLTAFSLNVFHSASRFCLDVPDREGQRALLGSGLIAYAVAACLAAAALVALAPVAHSQFGLAIDTTALWMAAAAMPSGAIVEAFVQTAVIRGASRAYAALVVSQAALTCAGTYVFVLMLDMDIGGYFVAVVVASLATAVVGMRLLGHEFRFRSSGGHSWRRHLRFGAPFTVASLIQYGFAVFVRVLLVRVGSAEALGWYGLAERAQAPMNLVVAAAGRSWLPWLITRRPTRGSDVSGPVLELSTLVLAVLGTMMIFLHELLRLVGGERYDDAYPAAMLLLVAAWVYFLGDWIASGTLSLTGQTHYRISIFAVAHTLGALVVAIMVPAWQSTGVAVGVVAVSTVILAGMIVVGARIHRLNFGFRRLIPVSSALVVVAACGSLATPLWLKLAVLVLYAAVMWTAGLIRRRGPELDGKAQHAPLPAVARPR